MTKAKAMSLLRGYVHAVVGRYRGKIATWDVVNEPIEDQANNQQTFNIRNMFWHRVLGKDYIPMQKFI